MILYGVEFKFCTFSVLSDVVLIWDLLLDIIMDEIVVSGKVKCGKLVIVGKELFYVTLVIATQFNGNISYSYQINNNITYF